jgi:hypothetical protein
MLDAGVRILTVVDCSCQSSECWIHKFRLLTLTLGTLRLQIQSADRKILDVTLASETSRIQASGCIIQNSESSIHKTEFWTQSPEAADHVLRTKGTLEHPTPYYHPLSNW